MQLRKIKYEEKKLFLKNFLVSNIGMCAYTNSNGNNICVVRHSAYFFLDYETRGKNNC